MIVRIGIENNVEGRTHAWVLGHPDCYAYGRNEKAVISAASNAIREYADWIKFHSKLLRRAVWHERGHTEHIHKLLN